MFSAFDPTQAQVRWFERRRGPALALAVAVHALVLALLVWYELHREDQEIAEVVLDEPVIENLAEELEPEEEPEPQPEPQPQPRAKPRTEIRNVTEQTKSVVEAEIAPPREAAAEDTGPVAAPKEAPKPTEVPAAPKPAVKKRSDDIGDREAPRPMPADGTPPRPMKENKAPDYPEPLRQANITGLVKVKLNIHMDGSVRGMKVLQKDVAGTDDEALREKARGLFLKSVVTAVKTWQFHPASLKGQTIAVWWPVTIPFNLS
jgi:outer membrane biosynthesis protein TonB